MRVCLSVSEVVDCFYQINVKTAELLKHTFVCQLKWPRERFTADRCGNKNVDICYFWKCTNLNKKKPRELEKYNTKWRLENQQLKVKTVTRKESGLGASNHKKSWVSWYSLYKMILPSLDGDVTDISQFPSLILFPLIL